MPNRIIREAILSSEKMALLGWPEEVFYRRLMSIVDDYGRYEANPQLLRARCYPLQTDAVRAADISRWMAACQTAGLILCYEVSGKCYVEVINFQQQQRSASKYPPCVASEIICNQVLADAHLGVSVFGVVSEVVKTASQSFVLPEWIPEDTWAAYCKVRTGKKAKNEPHALGLIVKDLEKFKAAGHNPVECLNNSIKSGWAGVFEPKSKAVQFPDKNSIPPISTIWHESAAGVAAKAAELRLNPQGDTESHPAFKSRVQAAIGRPALGFNQLAAMAAQRMTA
ncbi:MAG: hypothetical protein JJD98_00395 [Polaromonas sp.]|nr:hypothetical protein [Polaromonas sp.]